MGFNSIIQTYNILLIHSHNQMIGIHHVYYIVGANSSPPHYLYDVDRGKLKKGKMLKISYCNSISMCILFCPHTEPAVVFVFPYGYT